MYCWIVLAFDGCERIICFEGSRSSIGRGYGRIRFQKLDFGYRSAVYIIGVARLEQLLPGLIDDFSGSGNDMPSIMSGFFFEIFQCFLLI